MSAINILTARAKRNAPPPNTLGVVYHNGYGLINDGSKTVRGYLNAISAYFDSLQRYSDVNDAIRLACEHLLLQVGMKKGVKMSGKRGVRFIYKEVNKFNGKKVVRPMKRSEITNTVRKKAIGYLMFLKQEDVPMGDHKRYILTKWIRPRPLW